MSKPLIKNWESVKDLVNGKTHIDIDGHAKFIEDRNGSWIDVSVEYADVNKEAYLEAKKQGKIDAKLLDRKRQEFDDLNRNFSEPRNKGRVILDSINTDNIVVRGRNEAIQQAEKDAGIEYEREMVWLDGAEATSGVIVLPHDDYDRVYVIEGNDINSPSIRFIDEYVEGMERPYYQKIDGETHIFVNHFSGGAGTQASPYIISTPTELQNINNNLSAWYTIDRDIDMTGFAFITIGRAAGSAFTGNLDGRGYTISNLTIDATTASSGLFYFANGSTMKIANIRFLNPNIKTTNFLGGVLAGQIGTGFVENIQIENGKVECVNNTNVGGFCGSVGGATIQNCFVQMQYVKGANSMGGFAYEVNTSSKLYNIIVSAPVQFVQNSSTGGFIGYQSGSTYQKCFWDSTIQSTYSYTPPAGIYGMSTTSLRTKNTYTSSGGTGAGEFNFKMDWSIDEGVSYPKLDMFIPRVGTGTQADPYQITKPIGLRQIEWNMAGYYKLMNNLDLSSTIHFQTLGKPLNGATPIPFKGTLDGNGYVIKNLYINDSASYARAGLFSTFNNNAVVKNLGLENVNIALNEKYVGAIVGYVEDISGTKSLIDNCWSTGAVSSTLMSSNGGKVGGLAGYSIGLDIRNSWSGASVDGHNNLGGLVGYFEGNASPRQGTTTDCYSYGKILGSADVYSIASYVGVTGNGTTVHTRAYTDIQASGKNTLANGNSTAGITGKTTAEMKSGATYVGWDFNTIWSIAEGTDYPKLKVFTKIVQQIASRLVTTITGKVNTLDVVTRMKKLQAILAGFIKPINAINIKWKKTNKSIGGYTSTVKTDVAKGIRLKKSIASYISTIKTNIAKGMKLNKSIDSHTSTIKADAIKNMKSNKSIDSHTAIVKTDIAKSMKLNKSIDSYTAIVKTDATKNIKTNKSIDSYTSTIKTGVIKGMKLNKSIDGYSSTIKTDVAKNMKTSKSIDGYTSIVKTNIDKNMKTNKLIDGYSSTIKTNAIKGMKSTKNTQGFMARVSSNVSKAIRGSKSLLGTASPITAIMDVKRVSGRIIGANVKRVQSVMFRQAITYKLAVAITGSIVSDKIRGIKTTLSPQSFMGKITTVTTKIKNRIKVLTSHTKTIFSKLALVTKKETGTAQYPFLINTINDWNTKVTQNATSGMNFKLMANLDFANVAANFKEQTSFTGTFDGNGFVFMNLNWNKTSNPAFAIFRTATNSTIRNLTVRNTNISIDNDNAGTFVGSANNTIIENCFGDNINILNNNNLAHSNWGGIVGKAYNGSIIRNCYVSTSGQIAVSNNGGAIVGSLEDTSRVENCYSERIALNTSTNKGFIVGYKAPTATAVSCYFDTTYTGYVNYAGVTKIDANQKQIESTFVGWDFASIWKMSSAKPVLRVFGLPKVIKQIVNVAFVKPIKSFAGYLRHILARVTSSVKPINGNIVKGIKASKRATAYIKKVFTNSVLIGRIAIIEMIIVNAFVKPVIGRMAIGKAKQRVVTSIIKPITAMAGKLRQHIINVSSWTNRVTTSSISTFWHWIEKVEPLAVIVHYFHKSTISNSERANELVMRERTQDVDVIDNKTNVSNTSHQSFTNHTKEG